MRRLAQFACLFVVAALAGCGLGQGKEQESPEVTLSVTRDLGNELLASDREPIRENETVMRLLKRHHEVKTHYGGSYAKAIDGLARRKEGADEAGWLFYVNGIEADLEADEYEVHRGDVVQWDYRDWDVLLDVRATVGAFPQPFVNGRVDTKRLPTRLECGDPSSFWCHRAEQALRKAGAPVNNAALGAPGGDHIVRMIVGEWKEIRRLPTVRLLEKGPRYTGIFARFSADGDRMDFMNSKGHVVRSAYADVGLVGAMKPTETEVVWIVTALESVGMARALDALDPKKLRNAFAVLRDVSGVHKLPYPVR